MVDDPSHIPMRPKDNGSQTSTAAAAAKSLQSCPTLCDPIDSSPSGSTVPGIRQARRLEWGAISFSNAWRWKVKGKSFSRVRLFMIPWTAAFQAPQSMGFLRQEYWSGLPFPSPGDLPDPGIEPLSPTSPAKIKTDYSLLQVWDYFKKKKFNSKVQLLKSVFEYSSHSQMLSRNITLNSFIYCKY